MIRRAALLLLLAGCSTPQTKAPELSVARIYSDPPISGSLPAQVRWRPDSKAITFVEKDQLIQFDIKTGERKVLADFTPEAQAHGIGRNPPSTYLWSPDSKTLLFYTDGAYYAWDGTLKLLTRNVSVMTDPQWSPNGRHVSFIRDHDLWIVDLEGHETRLTKGGSESLLNGDLDWVYPEELGISSGYSWSEDSRKIAFLQLDESGVSRFPIVDYQPTKGVVRWEYYPKSGDANPKARVGVVSLDGNVEWSPVTDEYIARWAWNRGRLYVETMNRAQTKRTIWIDGKQEIVDEDSAWIDVTELHFMGDRLIRLTENSGWRHIEGFTSGEWEVESIVGVHGDWIYYLSNEGNDLERHLWRANAAGRREQLTHEPGTHSVTLSPDGEMWFDTWSSASSCPEFRCGSLRIRHEAPRAPRPEFLKIDGCRASVLKPIDFNPRKKYPVLIYTYGGPGAQVVANRWGGSTYLWHAIMAQRGFVVFSIDGGGAGGLGREFTRRLCKRLGQTELAGQLKGVEWLKAQPWVDASRIGIWGWSYGGYLTTYALTRSDVFRAGAAVAPVTDWKNYDTIYTERYLKTPRENPEGYARSSPDPARLHGKLLLVHGLADDNVHWQNTVQFVDALIAGNAKFELMVYPRKEHSIWGKEVRTHLFEKLTEFFDRELK